MKKLGLFVIAYFILTMSWAYPWHMVFFHDQYVEWGAVQREEPIIPLGIAAILIQGLVIGYLYQHHHRHGGNPIFEGIKFNLIVGLMTYSAMGFATAAKFDINPITPFLLFHTVFQFIQFTITGAALGWIYGSKGETHASSGTGIET